MDQHKPRKIAFREVYETNGWSIKIYTISKTGDFDHPDFYNKVKAKLPEWIQMNNSFASSNEKVGFLILHSGNEGIFSLINWWIGDNMLNTHIFLTEAHKPNDFSLVSGIGDIFKYMYLGITCNRYSYIAAYLRLRPLGKA